MKNTKKQGRYTLFVYREKSNYYMGVCLEFDLIAEGKTLEEALKNINNMAIGYLLTVWKGGHEDYLLNQSAPGIYWRKYYQHLKKRERIAKIVQKLKDKRGPKSSGIRWNDWAKEPFVQEVPYRRDKVAVLK